MIEIDARTQWKGYQDQSAYLRGLIALTGLSQRQCAARLGVPPREMRAFLIDHARSSSSLAPYCV